MSNFARDVITNCRKWIKDLTDDSVSETLCADEFAGLLDDALDEIELLNARIAELEAAQRWIPVGERLPEERQNVLALDKTGTAYHWEYSRSLSNIFVSDYTHWMPLPEAPNV